jgi:hypothetical protein
MASSSAARLNPARPTDQKLSFSRRDPATVWW